MRDVRVLLVAAAEVFGGAERALLLTVEALLDAGQLPHVVVGTDGELLAQLRARHLPCTLSPLEHSNIARAHRWAWSVGRLALLIRRHRAVLVHANDVPSFQPAGYAARWLRIPAVTHVRFIGSGDELRWFLKPGFARAIFVSEFLRTDSERAAPALFSNRAVVVHDGVEILDVPAESDRRAGRTVFHIPSDRPAIVLAGQVVEFKGIWEFIEAAAWLHGEGLSATFVVLGDDLKGQGATRIAAESRVSELGLQNDFRFLGFRSDAPRLIPLFDIVAVPSHIEALGNATLEAMAAARPVVGSAVGGIPEMIVDGETGLLVPPRNGVALGRALATLARSPGMATRLGDNGRRRAQEHFSLEAHAGRITDVYNAVLQEPALATSR